jgi:hypothetical protein
MGRKRRQQQRPRLGGSAGAEPLLGLLQYSRIDRHGSARLTTDGTQSFIRQHVFQVEALA